MKKIIATAFALLPCLFASAASDAILLKKGKKVFTGIGACAACHGPKGAGDGPTAAALNPKPRSFVDAQFKFDTDKDGKTGTTADLTNIVTKGAMAYGGSPLMAPRPDIKGDDLKGLILYVESLKKPAAK